MTLLLFVLLCALCAFVVNALWYRVFGVNEVQPAPAAILELIQGLGIEASGRFRGDDQGWFRADLAWPGEAEPLRLERYLSTEEGIRAELSTWAAWLEAADAPESGRLMQRMIGTRQIFTLEAPPEAEEEETVERVCLLVCRFLAGQTDGVYQVDGQGFFGPEGALLVAE